MDGIATDISVYQGEFFELRVVDGYWSLNGRQTKAKAYQQPRIEYQAPDEYKRPALTIYKGVWRLDGISTGIAASGFENELILNINNGYWYINGKDTNIKAREKISDEEYAIPVVTKHSVEGNRVYALDDVATDISADLDGTVHLEISENGFWLLNGYETEIKAEKNGEKIINDGYLLPIVDIDGSGYFTINNIRTNIKAENNLMITEILITFLLVQLILPLMYLISRIMKRLRLIS